VQPQKSSALFVIFVLGRNRYPPLQEDPWALSARTPPLSKNFFLFSERYGYHSLRCPPILCFSAPMIYGRRFEVLLVKHLKKASIPNRLTPTLRDFSLNSILPCAFLYERTSQPPFCDTIDCRDSLSGMNKSPSCAMLLSSEMRGDSCIRKTETLKPAFQVKPSQLSPSNSPLFLLNPLFPQPCLASGLFARSLDFHPSRWNAVA